MVKYTLYILALSAALALIYNSMQIKPLPLVHKETVVLTEQDFANMIADSTDFESSEEKTLSYQQVKSIIDDERFYIIDARSHEDYEKEHIGNSTNIFPYEDEGEYFGKILNLPREKMFVIYCNGGNCDLSHKLADDMKNLGFPKIFIYVGGWEDWEKNGK